MDGAGDIVAVSIPFTSGVAVAAFLLPEGGGSYLWMTLSCSVIIAALCIAVCRSGSRIPAVLALFFFTGVACWMSASSAIAPGPDAAWLKESMSRFVSLLDSIEYGHADTGGLVKALLTGDRGGIGRDITADFRRSGASHILALSGLHLGVIYGIMYKVLSILGNSRPAAIVRSTVIIAAAAFYTALTGAGPSIVRAFLFILLGEMSRLFPGRRRNRINIFCAALTIQLCANPLSITSVSFQLSYSAMLGILLIFPRLNSWYPESGKFDLMRKIWTSMAMSISCQVFTAPLAWHYFHSFPAYFLLTNLIALPLTEMLIVSAVATVVLTAFGVCPEMLKGLTDILGQTLVSSLKIIGSL